jgi:NTP pyrophosphatase (non-canonical NTP hydrolase)
MIEDQNTIKARVNEIDLIINEEITDTIKEKLKLRKQNLIASLDSAQEPILSSIIRSHKAICAVKNMDEKAAYGNDPSVYYTLAINAESGEMANNIVRSLRNGYDRSRILDGIRKELPDIIIYSYVLAYVLDIDLTKLVNEKVEIVIERANNGYYGGTLDTTTDAIK